jgi:hypothetical protein
VGIVAARGEEADTSMFAQERAALNRILTKRTLQILRDTDVVRPKARRELLAKRIKKPDDPLKLVIGAACP